jgi:mitochondrial pyruvate carrier 2
MDCSLAAVNFFLALVGVTQLTRIALYESSKKGGAAVVVEDVKKDVKENVEAAKEAVKDLKP